MARLVAHAAIAIAARHVGIQRAMRHAPRRVLRVGQRIEIDDRRAERGREMDGAAVVRQQQLGRLDQRAEFAKRQHAGKRQRTRPHPLAYHVHQRTLARAARHGDAVEQRRDTRGRLAEAFGRPAPRRRARARMHDQPARARRVRLARPARALQRRTQPRMQRAPRRVAGLERHPPIGRVRADRAHQRKLARNLVAHPRLRLGLRHAVTQQLIRILAAMREPQRNAREPAHHRGRQRALAVDGEDHGRVETARQQLVDHAAVGGRIAARIRMLDPRRVVYPYVVDHRQMIRERGARVRGQQREPAPGAAFLQRAHCGRRHQHVAEIVQPHAQNAPRTLPRGAHCRLHEPWRRVASRTTMSAARSTRQAT